MKRIFAMLLFFTLLSGCLFSYAEDIAVDEINIVGEEIEDEIVEEADLLLEEESLSLGEEEWLGEIEGLDLQPDSPEKNLEMETEFSEANMTANSGTGTKIGDYSYTFSNGVATIVGYSGSSSSIVFPERVSHDNLEYVVAGLGYSAFAGYNRLESVTIPATMNSLGDYAFKDCVNLKSVTINGDLKTPYRAFYNTGSSSGGYEVVFGNGVTGIPNDIFATGSSKANNAYAHVKKITMADSVTSIGNYAFEKCYDLASISWSRGLQTIGGYAFGNDIALTTVDLPGKVISVGYDAFINCTGLTALTIPSATNSLGDNAFKDCVNLKSVTINGDLKAPYRAFYNTGSSSGGYEVVFGNGVTSIPNDIFATGSSKANNAYAHVKKITMTDSVTSIGNYAFEKCYDLASISWSRGLQTIGNYAFGNDIALTTVDLPGKVISVGYDAFINCTGLTALTIPSTTNSLGDYAFKDCVNLKSVTINGDLKAPYRAFYNTGSSSGGYEVVFGNGVTSIPNGLFATGSSKVNNEYAHIKSATIPTSVATIGNSAFAECYALTSVVYGGSKSAWNFIAIGSNNEYLLNASFTFGRGGTVIATGVTLSQTTLSLSKGANATLTATVVPADTTDKRITWSSSDSAVATVSSSGVVEAVAKGTAIITATSVSDISKKAACTVTVASDAVLATSIALDRPEVTLKVGETATLIRTILPADVTAAKGGYQISDKAVFEVSAAKNTGNTCKYTIKAVGVGTAKLTVSTMDGTKLSASCTVNVIPDVPEKRLTKTGSNGTVKVEKGGKLQLVASFASQKGWKIKSISSSNKKVATVTSAGLVTAKKAGTATITVKTKNGKKATVKIKVIDPKLPTKVTLNKTGTVKLKKGSTLQLEATVLPDTAETALTWKSSNKKIATVSSSGLVKAKKKGAATITVKTKNGKTAKVKIKVVK